LEGPFTVFLILVGLSFLEALFFLLVGLLFFEELPSLVVGPFFGRGQLILFKELPFMAGVSSLHALLAISKEHFIIVVFFPVLLEHLTVTEELVFTVGVSVLESSVTQFKQLLPLMVGVPPSRDT
jgi:hypothetical protein